MGGLPQGRPTLVCGAAGCGKTLFAVEFLVRGAIEFGEPGVLLAFEETPPELAQNVASLGMDLEGLIGQKLLVVDHVEVVRHDIEETGEYDLEGLFVRLGYAIDSIGAKRVVLDTIENLFGGLDNTAVLRAELRRLFRWLKDKGVTAVITAERGEGTLTRHGLEEYVSDCVILLDHRVDDQLSTRRMRIVKYRGSAHGTDEFPFLIDQGGISVLPLTSVGKLDHVASTERISTGVPRLNTMLGGGGYYRGSSVLISGTAGTGKSSLVSHFAAAQCEQGERVVYFAFEESQSEILRNMRSVGLDLQPWIDKGLLYFHTARPTQFGLESHLATIHKVVNDKRPSAVVIDPISSFLATGSSSDVKSLLARLFDLLKSRQITAVMTSLTAASDPLETTSTDVSSLIDTWLLLESVANHGERNRQLHILKSRGMAHSNQLREFHLSRNGIELADAYLGPAGVLTGSARVAQEANERAAEVLREQNMERKRRELERRREAFEAQVEALRKQFEADLEEQEQVEANEIAYTQQLQRDRADMATSRHAKDDGQGPQRSDRRL